MNKHALRVLATTAAFAATVANAEPSRLFSQETADVTKDVSVDLDYVSASNGLAAGLRVGAFDGEVLVNTKNSLALDFSGFVGSNAGFKMPFANNLALYGILGYNKQEDVPADTNFAFGAAYTLRQGDLLLNFNGEFVTDDNGNNGRGDDDTLFLKAGVGYTLPEQKSGKFTLIGEISVETSDVLDTTFNLGVRWQPRKNVSADFVLISDSGDNGSASGIPGAVRVNIAF